MKFFRGSELQNYFTKILEENLKAILKPQYVDQIPKAAQVNRCFRMKTIFLLCFDFVQGLVADLLNKKDELGNQAEIAKSFDLENVKDRQIADLSGGELQRFACAMVCIQKGDIFMFDEPSSYLDVKQRLKAALAIRDIIRENRFVIYRVYLISIVRISLDILLLSNMICRFWIIFRILFVFCMVHRDITELLLCLFLFVKVRMKGKLLSEKESYCL